MTTTTSAITPSGLRVVKALGEEPALKVGDRVRISIRFPIGHYRVPLYVRGKQGVVEMILSPVAVNNEEEGYGRNAGIKGYYYRVGILLLDLWPGYAGPPQDRLFIEVFETWLERI
ncbi:MAG: nitrile hydratase subunit beta [Pseudomonadota bacterium]|nr:nitrile hydratase subunit beta [Pseudomonadota bacterium]